MGIITENHQLAEELSRYSRLCYDRRLVGAAGGNLSLRIPQKDEFLVTASGVSLRDVAPQNLVVVDFAGNVLDNPASLKPSKEINFHLAIFAERPAVNAVIHVHPAYTTIFTVRRKPIPLVTVSSRLKLKQGKIVGLANPGSRDLCNLVIQSLHDSPPETEILLMEDHGLIAFHATLAGAFDAAELAEDTAKIALNCESRWPGAGRIIDLSLPLSEKTPFYPTDPPYRQSWHVTFQDTGMNVSRMEFGPHLGTHVDAPLHFIDRGMDIASMAPDRFFGEAVAIDIPKGEGENISSDDFSDADIRPGDIVLFRTGWEKRAGSQEFFKGEWPGFTLDAIEALIAKRVKAIGGDTPSADSPKAIGLGAPAHKRAFAAGLPIFEALINFGEVVGRRFFFIGLPLKLENVEASPVRSIALLD
jgi:kynurenine formamidase/ribulose-5-phosphate 4-epimerase/fuculose-1-phosphate aldolase